jgi:WD40 repeat protein
VLAPYTRSSADGAWCVIADQTLTVWDLTARKLLVALLPEQSSVLSVSWSPNHELLAVGTRDGSLEIWNLPQINAKLAEIGLGWEVGQL